MGHFDWSFKNKWWYFDIPQTLAFSTNMRLWSCYSKNYFECTLCPTSLFCGNFNPNFVHHHFWPKLFQALRYILWFILINLISCGASQSTNVLILWFFFFWQWAIWLAHHQKHHEIPSFPSKNTSVFPIMSGVNFFCPSMLITCQMHVKKYPHPDRNLFRANWKKID